MAFNDIVIDSIDEVLLAIGGSAKHLIYFVLSNDFGISKNQIPNNINAFVNVLHTIFGVGAKHLERHLLKLVETKTDVIYPLPVQASSLQDILIYIRLQYEKQC